MNNICTRSALNWMNRKNMQFHKYPSLNYNAQTKFNLSTIFQLFKLLQFINIFNNKIL
jgi:hypothetical protein